MAVDLSAVKWAGSEASSHPTMTAASLEQVIHAADREVTVGPVKTLEEVITI